MNNLTLNDFPVGTKCLLKNPHTHYKNILPFVPCIVVMHSSSYLIIRFKSNLEFNYGWSGDKVHLELPHPEDYSGGFWNADGSELILQHTAAGNIINDGL